MKPYCFTLRPLTPFGSPLAGDTLFGHLCWALLERFGRNRLASLLDGYTEGKPFAVLSDAFPQGCLPRPDVPATVVGWTPDPRQRKQTRARAWLPVVEEDLPLLDWLAKAREARVSATAIQTQNTIDRLTGTTGEGQFAPRQVERIAFGRDCSLDLYAVLDEGRLTVAELRQLMEDIGTIGYGRDASTGLGKFSVVDLAEVGRSRATGKHWLTLAPCAPDPAVLDAAHCFYQPVTRFGRHGNLGVRLGRPFKRPLLLLKTGAFLTSQMEVEWHVHGRGLGGPQQPISHVIPETVHQGYAPVVPLNAELLS